MVKIPNSTRPSFQNKSNFQSENLSSKVHEQYLATIKERDGILQNVDRLDTTEATTTRKDLMYTSPKKRTFFSGPRSE